MTTTCAVSGLASNDAVPSARVAPSLVPVNTATPAAPTEQDARAHRQQLGQQEQQSCQR
jgi:hypothetical protein